MLRGFRKIILLLVIFVSLAAFFLFTRNVSAQTPSPAVCGNSPSDVVLVIDRSGSMKNPAGTSGTKISNAKSAAATFVNLLSADTRNRVGLVSFATNSSIDSNLTANFESVKTKISNLTAGGDTCTECGAFKANSNIVDNGRTGVKKVVILLTDGKANVIQGSPTIVGGNQAEQKAITEIKNSYAANGTVYFTIGLGDNINASFLREIASVTGGKYYASPTTDQLNNIYQEISQVIAKGSINGVVFNDANSNGALDTQESNLPGWTVQLLKTGSSTQSLVSDANGGFSFQNLCDGSYTLKQTVKSGWRQTLPVSTNGYALSLSNGNSLTNKNFGNSVLSTPTPTPSPAPDCVKNVPQLEVTPSNIEGLKGVEKTYDVKLTNVDTGNNCPTVKFSLSKDLPGGAETSWTGRFNDNQLSLSKGQSKSTKLHVKSPSDALPAENTIWVRATRANGQEKSVRVTYTVIAAPTPTNRPPTPTPTNRPPTPTPTNRPPTPTPTNRPPATPSPVACVKTAPELIVVPPSVSAPKGTSVEYNITVKNKDSAGCAPRNLTLVRNLPGTSTTTWTGTFSVSAFPSLAPGAQGTSVLTVKSPTTATNGDKAIIARANNASGTEQARKEVIYKVIGVVGPSATPTIRPSATPTSRPSATPTIRPTATPRPTVTPTVRPTSTPTPTIPGNGALDVRIGIDGIGTTPRISIGGNQNPVNPNRNLNLSLYSTTTNTASANWPDWTFTYNPSSQKFENELAFSALPTGDYNVYLEGPGFIRARYPGSITVTAGQTTNLHSNNFYLITGNVNDNDESENRIDILDYDVLISCSIYSQDVFACQENPNYSSYSDLNDDGRIDEDDYTLFLKEFGNEGSVLP